MRITPGGVALLADRCGRASAKTLLASTPRERLNADLGRLGAQIEATRTRMRVFGTDLAAFATGYLLLRELDLRLARTHAAIAALPDTSTQVRERDRAG